MTIDQLRTSTDVYINAADVAPILRCDAQQIRAQAHRDPAMLGYPVVIIGRRVRIPRIPFLLFLDGRGSV